MKIAIIFDRVHIADLAVQRLLDAVFILPPPSEIHIPATGDTASRIATWAAGHNYPIISHRSLHDAKEVRLLGQWVTELPPVQHRERFKQMVRMTDYSLILSPRTSYLRGDADLHRLQDYVRGQGKRYVVLQA